MRHLYILIGLLLLMETTSAHPLHLSITNIDFVGDTAKISIRVFDNEWFLHLAQCYPEATFSGKADSSELNQQFIISYFKKSLWLGVENTNILLSYTENKMEEGSVWYYFSAIIPSEIEKCTIENRILTECYGDQKNLTVIKKGNFESGLEFDSIVTRAEVKLK